MSHKTPTISVILPVYNAEQFIWETLCSLMMQTYEDFEIIAIDDGSTDNSLRILKRYAQIDSRIKITSRKNHGLVYTLNEAIDIASGKYLARIDADDTCMPRRFELQKQLLDSDTDCVLVCSSFEVMDMNSGHLYTDTPPIEHSDILMAMYTRNPIAHASVMYRKSTVLKLGGYSETCGPTEDYELWTRLAKAGTIRTVKESLVRWRVNESGITSTRSKAVEENMKLNLNKYWADHPFKVYDRATLKSLFGAYLLDRVNGVQRKEKFTYDLIAASIELAKRKEIKKSIMQLLIVASTGRSGVRLIIRRIKPTVLFYFNKLYGRHK